MIGIIASITVPMIHANYQKQATVSKLKKAYANLSNAIKLSELENGPLKEWEFPNINSYNDEYEAYIKKYFYPYIRINKEGRQNEYSMQSIDGNNITIAIDKAWENLADGTSISFYKDSSQDSTFWIFIDLNSSAKPNKLGRDIFVFNIYKRNKLEFYGQGNEMSELIDDASNSCKRGTGQKYAGAYCGAWIFNNGWEMPKDYPL